MSVEDQKAPGEVDIFRDTPLRYLGNISNKIFEPKTRNKYLNEILQSGTR
jgi:hypothetical protein